MLSQRIWSPIGCEEDGYLGRFHRHRDGRRRTQRPCAIWAGSANSCAARAWRGKQVLPAEVIADIRRGSDPAKLCNRRVSLAAGLFVPKQVWWVSHNALDAFEGRGIHGQRLYIAPG